MARVSDTWNEAISATTAAISATKRFLFRRKTAYIQTFSNPVGEIVLADLARFCRAFHSTFNPDPRVHALLEGRREVWQRITDNLNLTQDELWKRYGRPDLEEKHNV
jgi:hypothetical protein